jgi:hypothetical protein
MTCPQRTRRQKREGEAECTEGKARRHETHPGASGNEVPGKNGCQLEALAEADQDTVLNYVNAGMRINDAYQRTIAGKPEQQQQPETAATTPTAEGTSPEAGSAGLTAAEATPEATPGAAATPPAEATQAPEPGTQPKAKNRAGRRRPTRRRALRN